MKVKLYAITLWAGGLLCRAQVPTVAAVRPEVVGRTVREGQVTTVYLAPRFATAIRMPEAVNSVVLGDPDSFAAEHNDKEPQVVFVKPITAKPAQTNLLIATVKGHQANLLLISRGETKGMQPSIDFLLRYRPTRGILIEPSDSEATVAPTELLSTSANRPVAQAANIRIESGPETGVTSKVTPVTFTGAENSTAANANANRQEALASDSPSDSVSDLDKLLDRQRKAPLPELYGEKPGIPPPGKQLLEAGVSEVIDQGREVVVLFSVVNVQNYAVELTTPQVQLAGQVKKGRHQVWSNSEQLPVEAWRLSRRRLGAGERADGVALFERPSFKQSNETMLLQIADTGDIDRPALAPIGFGISSLREGGE
jgi:hypothetical protein